MLKQVFTSRLLFIWLSIFAASVVTLSIPTANAQAGINITYPSTSGVCNVITQYSAAGNGTTDDTAAIQNALNACQIVYLPNATYRITGALLWPTGFGNVQMVGQTQTGAVIRLDNNKFTSASSPTAILDVCHGGCPSYSNYFNAGIRNLTLNTGSGNPGAIGIQFFASNIGAMRDVTVTSADGQGIYGLSLDSSISNSANGPFLIKNITVNGFQTGVEASIGAVDSATLEHIYVNNQTVSGMNINGTVSLRDLESSNTVRALTMSGGFLTMIDSVLSNGSGTIPAISITSGDVLLRNITTSGYSSVLVEGENTLTSPISEWTNDAVYNGFNGTGTTLGLPISETPETTWDDASTWMIVTASGGDDTPNLQAALNSGATTVCLCGGGFNISSTLSVGASVYHVIGINATIYSLPSNGQFPPPANLFDGPVFQMAYTGPPTVVFENLLVQSGKNIPLFSNPSARTMVVLDSGGNVSASGGNNYLENVASSNTSSFSGGSTWARQFNTEDGPAGTTTQPLVTNQGGSLWILGQKQEGGAETIQATGGQTELLGGLMYDCCGVGTSEFVVNNGQFSARIYEYNCCGLPNFPYWTNFVQDTEHGQTEYIADGGSTYGVLGLYTNAPDDTDTMTPSAPAVSAATAVTLGGFTANWAASTEATLYYLDVSTSSTFHSFVSGYHNLSVGNLTSYPVSGLAASTTYYYRVRASNSAGTSHNSSTITVTTYAGSLAGSVTVSTGAVSLTTVGTTDWAHWPGYDRKASGGGQISNYSIVGSGTVYQYGNDSRPISWSDGTPTGSSTYNTNGLDIAGIGNGYQITVPADTTTRTITVYVGGYQSAGTLTAHLSDGSSADFVNYSPPLGGSYDRNYTLTYHAASAGKQLVITWVMNYNVGGAGNVTLQGAALSGGSSGTTAATPTFSPGSGTYSSAQSVTISDTTPGATIYYTTDGTTPTTNSSVYSSAINVSATTVINAIGATGPSTDSAVATATYTFITPAATPTFSPAAGTYSAAQSVTVNDTTPGATIYYTTDGTTPTTSSPIYLSPIGVSTTTTIKAIALAGGYGTSAVASATYTITGSGPSVIGSVTTSTNAVNLTTVGTTDWAHWPGYDHKSTGGSQISNYSIVGSGTVNQYGNDLRPLSWTDGTPTASSTSNTNGLYIAGGNNGYQITVPADATLRTITVYAGGYQSAGTLTAHLSDGSAADYVATLPAVGGQFDDNYTLTYKAGSAGQQLVITWVLNTALAGGNSNVTLQGAALQ